MVHAVIGRHLPAMRLNNNALIAFLGAVLLCGCGAPSSVGEIAPESNAESNAESNTQSNTANAATSATSRGPKPQLGLMTSLPLYWPIDADFGALASGEADIPAQRSAFEATHDLVLLDTLSPIAGSPIAGTTPNDPETDPLGKLDYLAVIQPRVLTPADNVALDNWVRAGGQLLLVLDPLLDGHYRVPLGDPRRPVEAALIPPVLARWGLELRFDETQQRAPRAFRLGGIDIPIALSGELREIAGTGADCELVGGGVMARCQLGKGRLTVLADAEAFKDMGGPDHANDDTHQHGGEPHKGAPQTPVIQVLVGFAFETR